MTRKRFVKVIGLLLAIICLFGMIGCQKPSGDGGETPPPGTGDTTPGNTDTTAPAPKLNKTKITLNVGESETLTVSNYDGTVEWSTSSESIATVSGGVVTGAGDGTAYITAKCGEKELTCRVVVTEKMVAVPTLVLDKKETQIARGRTLTITPYIVTGDDHKELDKGDLEWSTSDSAVLTVADGVVTGVGNGTATVTAKYQAENELMSATAEISVVNMNYYKALSGDVEITPTKPLRVVVADDYLGTTTSSTATVKIMEVDFETEEETDVTSQVQWTSTDASVATAAGGTVTGATKNGNSELIATVGGKEATRVYVESWTEISTKAHMDKLALATWTERDDADKIKKILGGRYVLTKSIDYEGEYILPIANTQMDSRISWASGIISYCSWVWKDILSDPNITAPEDWAALKFNTADNTFTGSNPNNLPFTGVFDGNGYAIQNAQILDVNYFLTNRANNTRYTAAGGCFIGTIGEGGILRNVNFEGLRFRKYYSESKSGRERTINQDNVNAGYFTADEMEKTQLYCGSTKTMLPYYNLLRAVSDSALIRVNKGTVGNVRISAKVTYNEAVYGNNDANNNNNKRFALGVGINYETGEIDGLVVELLYGELEWLRHSDYIEGTDSNWSSAIISETGIYYNRNYGAVKNCIFLSDVAYNTSRRIDPTGVVSTGSRSMTSTYVWNCGKVYYNTSGESFENTNGQVANSGSTSNCFGAFADANDSATASAKAKTMFITYCLSEMDTIDLAKAWNLDTNNTDTFLTLKQGNLW